MELQKCNKKFRWPDLTYSFPRHVDSSDMLPTNIAVLLSVHHFLPHDALQRTALAIVRCPSVCVTPVYCFDTAIDVKFISA